MEALVRLCCLTRHSGVACPDGTFMCATCFEKIPLADAWRDEAGQAWDLCKPCKALEAKHGISNEVGYCIVDGQPVRCEEHLSSC